MEEINGGEGGCGEKEMERRAGRRQRYGIRKRERGRGRGEGYNGHLEGPTSVPLLGLSWLTYSHCRGGKASNE